MWRTTRKLAYRRTPWRFTESVGLPLRAGRWYGPTEIGTTLRTLTAGRIEAIPIYIPVTTFCQALGVEVAIVAAGKSVRLGLYADNGGVPGALLIDAGEVSVAVADEFALPISNWLRPGWYWLAVLSESSTPCLRDSTNSGPTRMGVATNIGTDVDMFVYAAQAYGALPADFPAITYGSTGSAPRLFLMGLSGMEDTSDGWRMTEDVEYGTLIHLPHVSGRYYGCPLTANPYPTRTLTLVAATMYAMPFLVGATHSYDRISIHVTTAGAAGKLAQLGIYADSGGVPGALILDAGNVSVASTGGKEININQSLARGWYWLACLSDGTPILRSYQGSYLFGWLGHTTGVDTTYYGGMTVAQAFGALPDPFTGGAVLASVPRILLRAT